MRLLRRLRALFRKGKLDADMAEELRAHLDLQTAENISRGLSPADARHAALRAFGGVEQIKERARDQRGWLWLDQARQDLRFAARGLWQSPVFAGVAIATLALGIGLNTAMFSVLQALLRRELPFPAPESLVQVFRTSPHSQRWPHSPANFLDQQAQNDVFTGMAAYQPRPFNLAEPGQPAERVGGVQASAEIFPLLGVRALLGRTFSAEEDRPGGERVVVLDHGFWQRRFAGDPAILGRTLRLDGEAFTVIGVMPANFRDRPLFGTSDLWTPLAFDANQRANRGGNFLRSIARLKPGVTLPRAAAALDALAARQALAHPATNTGIGLRAVPILDAMDPRGRLSLWATMALAGFVLLIACANLANLQFARTARRTRELAIRGALGASRGRLLRQLLTESLLLALLGGAAGLAVAQAATVLLDRALEPGDALAVALDRPVLAFAFAASTLSGLGFGLLPAWLAARADPGESIKAGGRGVIGDRARRRVQHALIVAEMALALVLLAGAGLMVRGVARFAAQSPGWDIDGLAVAQLALPAKRYGGSGSQRAFAARLEEKLAALPGVTHAAVAWSVPIGSFDTAGDFAVADRAAPPPGRAPLRHVNGVTPGYFAALGQPLRAGRAFTAADREEQPAVVIVNETLARTFWPDASALGRRIGDEEIVGVVADVRFPTDPSEPSTRFQTYRPFAQAPRGSNLWLAVRGPVSADQLRRAVAAIDADLPLHLPGTARSRVDRALLRLGQVGWLLTGFGALGVLLAALGLYGVIAGFVAHRTNEIGVRLALGAGPRDVLRLVLGQGVRLTFVGALIGLLGAAAATRLIAAVAPDLAGGDVGTLGAVTALLLAVALLACWLPARRATRIDPMLALRAE